MPSNFGGKLIQIILKFDFELATIVAETEAEDEKRFSNKRKLIYKEVPLFLNAWEN